MLALRRQDDVIVQPGPRILDPGGLAGRWINTNAHGRGISEIGISVNHGRVRLCPLGTAGDTVYAWGEADADLVCGSDVRAQSAMAFTAQYDFGGFQSVLQGNLNLGLLVVAGFNRVGARGHDFFAREFYRRGNLVNSPRAVPWSAAFGTAGGDDPVERDPAQPGQPFDRSEMLGDWLNTNPDSNGIARLLIDDDGHNGAVMRAWGAQEPRPVEWGPAPAALFALNSGSSSAKAFSATYDTSDVVVTLQANIKQGVLVVASFTEFCDDSGRSNYFHREFYYQG